MVRLTSFLDLTFLIFLLAIMSFRKSNRQKPLGKVMVKIFKIFSCRWIFDKIFQKTQDK